MLKQTRKTWRIAKGMIADYNIIALICFALFCQTVNGYQEVWTHYHPIEVSGGITQITPTGANRRILHYAATGTPEVATFGFGETHDYDLQRYTFDGTTWLNGAVQDAGVEAADTMWLCTAGAGSCSQGALTSTFTPSNTVNSGIQIAAWIYEGHSLSWTSNDYDEAVYLEWGSSLTTFMVTVYMQPAGTWTKIAEDNAQDHATYANSSTMLTAQLELGTIDWTGKLWNGGEWPVSALFSSKTYEFTATARAESDNGQVGGILGTMRFSPSVHSEGSFNLYAVSAGPQGGAGAVTIATAGATNPYVKAGLAITSWALGSGSQVNTSVGGESVIEFASGGTKSLDASGGWRSHDSNADFAVLGQSYTEITSQAELTVRGSYYIHAKMQVMDNSVLCESSGRVTSNDTGGYIQASVGRPSYVP